MTHNSFFKNSNEKKRKEKSTNLKVTLFKVAELINFEQNSVFQSLLSSTGG